ncbi:MAG: cardiolipin synthase [Bacteroidaceae bacterium]|nr:cardiolipin synthase [Bacteroidaceae bacterium]
MYRIIVSLFICCFISLTTKAQSEQDEIKYLQEIGINTTDSNNVYLLTSGHDKFEDMFNSIRNAKKFIHLEYFNFRNDSIAGLLFDLLAEKVREGVEVRAMYDAFGNASNNQPIKRHQHDSICSAGIRLVKFDPLDFPWLTHIIPRDHRKIVVIDGRIAYTGGMNVADYYVDGLEGIGAWRDLHLHIEGAAVNELHKIFVRMWKDATDEDLYKDEYFPTPLNAGSARVAVVDRHPNETNKSIRQLYVSMLDNARHHIQLVNPYFVPTKKVRQALRRCIDRGVKVEIMLSEKSDIPLTPDASHYVGRLLQKRGAEVYMFRGGFHHTKMMIVDDKFCTIGSANLDSRSLRCDYEVNTVIFDQPTTDQLINMFENDKKSSIMMDTAYWKNKTKWKRFVSWFGNCLTPFL